MPLMGSMSNDDIVLLNGAYQPTIPMTVSCLKLAAPSRPISCCPAVLLRPKPVLNSLAHHPQDVRPPAVQHACGNTQHALTAALTVLRPGSCAYLPAQHSAAWHSMPQAPASGAPHPQSGKWQRWRTVNTGYRSFVDLQILDPATNATTDQCEMQLLAKDGEGRAALASIIKSQITGHVIGH